MNGELNNYLHTATIHNTRAAEAFLPYLKDIISPKSVVDIGCGLGTWLNIFKNNGVDEILGIDGNNINENLLQIKIEDFLLHDLNSPLSIDQKFDLAICLEVAEHLPERSSDIIVSTITQLSDTILFSAALPNQGGQNHINEQSFSYWVAKFNEMGFVVKDIFRKKTWNDEDIDWWYRQNIFLVVRSKDKQDLIPDFYHPNRYNQLANDYNQTKKELNDVYSGHIAAKDGLKIFLKSLLKIGK